MFNRILNLLENNDRERLQTNLEPIDLQRLTVLSEPNKPQDFTYFPESGIGSIMAVSPSGMTAEVGIFGREGMSPPNSLFEDDQAPFKVFMQVEGSAHRIRNEHLFAALIESRTMRKLLSATRRRCLSKRPTLPLPMPLTMSMNGWRDGY